MTTSYSNVNKIKHQFLKTLFRSLATVLLVCLFAGLLPPKAYGESIRRIPFSARLRTAGGEALATDGAYSITFRIFTALTGGTAAWTETQTITVTGGTVVASLGSVTAFPSDLLFENDSYYLEAQVGSDSPMVPRKRLQSVPSAFNANTLGGKSVGTSANNIIALNSSGNLSIAGTFTGSSLTINPASAEAVAVNPFGSSAGNTGEIRFYELTANGTNYVGLKSSDSIASSLTWKLPNTDGSASQVLTTDGAGQLSWATAATDTGWSHSGSYVILSTSGDSVGIGTSTPGSKLDVQGAIRLGATGANNILHTTAAASSPTGSLYWGSREICDSSSNCSSSGDITSVGSMASGVAFGDTTADDDWLGLGDSAGRIEFDDQATDEVNILTANVGIGTATPSYKLDVSGTFHVTGALTLDTALTVANGGTGATSFTSNGVLYGNGTGAIQATSAGSDGYCLLSSSGVPTWSLCTGGSGVGDVTAVGSMTSGVAFGDTTADDDWLGLGSSAGRIAFDDQATDYVNILTSNVGIGDSSPAALLTVGSGDLFQVSSTGGAVTITGVADGTDALTLTAGDILVTDGDLDLSGGDLNVTLDAADEVNITKTAAAAATEQGLAISLTAGAGDGSDVYSGLQVTATSANHSASSDKVYGIHVANLSSGDAEAEEIAIYQAGTSWDYGLKIEDSVDIDGAANIADTTAGADVAIGNATGNLTFLSDNADFTLTDATDNVFQLLNATNSRLYLDIDAGATDTITLGNSTDITSIVGSSSSTIILGGTSLSATELNLLNDHTTLVDTDDTVATAITGTGALAAGSLAAGFTTVVVARGGTGATTFTAGGVLYGNTTSAILATSAPASDGQCLVSASSVPTWAACTSGSGVGDVTSVTAGAGLTGTSETGPDVTLNVGSGTGISVAADAIAVNQATAFTWTGSHSWTFAAGGALSVDATTTDNTTTTGVVNLDIDTVTDGNIGSSIDYQVGDAASSLAGVYAQKIDLTVDTDAGHSQVAYGQYIGLTADDASSTTYGLAITAEDAGGQAATAGLLIQNLQATDIDLTDGILVQATTDGSLVDALDVSDAEITNALNVGANVILGTTPTINFNSFDVDGSGVVTNATWQGNTVGVAYGGTGAATFTTNGVLYGNGTGAVQVTAAGTDGYCLLSSSGVPTWSLCTGGSGVGDITAVGDVTSGAAFTGTAGTTLYFNDADGDGTLTIANLTGARTYTLPDATGNICLSSGNCVGSGSSSTLQAAYDAGASITTTDARDIDIVLANTTTDSNLDIVVATDSTSYVSITRAAGSGTANPGQLLLVADLDADLTIADGILIQAAGVLTDGLDVSDAEIANAVNVGANTIVGTAAVIDFSEFDVSGTTGTVTINDGGDAGALLVESTSLDINDLTFVGAGTLATGSASNLTINSGTTGTIAIGDDASAETINISTGSAVKTLSVGSTNSTSITTIQSGTGDIILSSSDDISATLVADGQIVINAATTDNTTTSGVIDLDFDTSTTAAEAINIALTAIDDDASDTIRGIQLDLTIQDDTTATDIVYGTHIDITNSDTNAAGTGVYISANDAGAGVVNSGIIIENLQATDIDLTDGILIRATTADSIVDALDVSDAEITNAINIGANNIITGSATIASTELDRLDGKDAALVDADDAVATAITGTGALAAGSLTTGFTAVNVAQGGTGASTLTSKGVLYGNGTSAVAATAAGATGECLVGNTGSAPTWTACSGLVTADSLDFTELQDTLDLDAALTLNQTTNTWSQTFTGDTTTGLTYTANSLTAGIALLATSSSLTTGKLVDIQVSGTAAGASQTALNVATAGANATSSITSYGLQVANTHTGTSSTNVAGLFTATGGTISKGLEVAAMSSATSTALAIGALSGTTANVGVDVGAISGSGATARGLTVGNISSTGATNAGVNLGTLTGGTTSNYQVNAGNITAIASATNAGINLGTISGTAASSTNAAIITGAISSTGTSNTGVSLGAISGAAATNYGINIGNISGATSNNYGILLGTLTGGSGSSVYGVKSGTLTSVASGTNYQLDLGAVAGATSATFGGINSGAVSGAGTVSYGVNLGANTATATDNYGLNIGAISGAGTNNFGINIANISGAGTANTAIKTGSATTGIEISGTTTTGILISGAATTGINLSSTSTTTDISLQNGETIDNNTNGTLNIGATTLQITGGTTVVSDQTTVALFNTTTTTLNVGGAVTTLALVTGNTQATLNIGTGTGGNTINIGTGVNTVAQTVNIATGAAGANTTINIGTGTPTTGTQTIAIGSTYTTSTTKIYTGATGGVKIGDGGTSNYTTIDSAGAISFAGNARPNSEITLLSDDAAVPASNGCTATTQSGTNFAYKTNDCDPTTDESFNYQFKMPGNYVSGSNIELTIYWIANNTTASEEAVFDASYVVGGSAVNFNTVSLSSTSSVTTTASTTAYGLNSSTITLTSPSINAGEVLNLKINRDANNAADDLDPDALILMTKVKFITGS